MFRAAYRLSSGAPNCICSLWFIYPCGDRPLSRLGGNSVPTQPGQRDNGGNSVSSFERHTAQHQELQTAFAASGLYTACGDRPLSRLGGNSVPIQPGQRDNGGYSFPNQPGQRPIATWVPANTVWSSWWWAVCRSKHVEPSINFGIINSITRLHLVGYLYWFILRCTDPWILNW
jgi:hypothetical protein